MEGVLHLTALFKRAPARFNVDNGSAVHAYTNEPHFPGISPS